MNRNPIKQCEIGKKAMPRNLEMSLKELNQIMALFFENEKPYEALWNMIATAWYFGYAVGIRQSKREVARNGKTKENKTR